MAINYGALGPSGTGGKSKFERAVDFIAEQKLFDQSNGKLGVDWRNLQSEWGKYGSSKFNELSNALKKGSTELKEAGGERLANVLNDPAVKKRTNKIKRQYKKLKRDSKKFVKENKPKFKEKLSDLGTQAKDKVTGLGKRAKQEAPKVADKAKETLQLGKAKVEETVDKVTGEAKRRFDKERHDTLSRAKANRQRVPTDASDIPDADPEFAKNRAKKTALKKVGKGLLKSVPLVGTAYGLYETADALRDYFDASDPGLPDTPMDDELHPIEIIGSQYDQDIPEDVDTDAFARFDIAPGDLYESEILNMDEIPVDEMESTPAFQMYGNTPVYTKTGDTGETMFTDIGYGPNAAQERAEQIRQREQEEYDMLPNWAKSMGDSYYSSSERDKAKQRIMFGKQQNEKARLRQQQANADREYLFKVGKEIAARQDAVRQRVSDENRQYDQDIMEGAATISAGGPEALSYIRGLSQKKVSDIPMSDAERDMITGYVLDASNESSWFPWTKKTDIRDVDLEGDWDIDDIDDPLISAAARSIGRGMDEAEARQEAEEADKVDFELKKQQFIRDEGVAPDLSFSQYDDEDPYFGRYNYYA